MMKVNEVAERLQVSDSIVYGLVEAGKLIAHRIGLGRGAIRISEDDFQAYLDSCRVERESQAKPRKSKLKHLKLN